MESYSILSLSTMILRRKRRNSILLAALNQHFGLELDSEWLRNQITDKEETFLLPCRASNLFIHSSADGPLFPVWGYCIQSCYKQTFSRNLQVDVESVYSLPNPMSILGYLTHGQQCWFLMFFPPKQIKTQYLNVKWSNHSGKQLGRFLQN